jgi:hypothetical protein
VELGFCIREALEVVIISIFELIDFVENLARVLELGLVLIKVENIVINFSKNWVFFIYVRVQRQRITIDIFDITIVGVV